MNSDNIQENNENFTMELKNTNNKEDREIEIIPNAMFPFCAYNNDYSEGVLVKEYEERFCNSFQVNTYAHLNHHEFRLLFKHIFIIFQMMK